MEYINFNSKEYKKSRIAYMAQCTFEYFVTLLVADAFLAKLLTALGISDSMIGIISSFVSLAFIFQLLSIFLVRLKFSTKKLVMMCDSISQLFFMLMFLIPFSGISAEAKKVAVTLAIIFAYASKYLISSICYKWANSYVHPGHRATYSANKEMVSLVSGILFTMLIGFIIDKFESVGNLNGGFLFIAVSILIMNICNFVCLFMIKDADADSSESAEESVSSVLKNTLLNKNFRNVIIMDCMWQCGRYITLGFLGVFKTNSLMMSLFLIQVVNMIASGARLIVTRPFGKFSDRTSYAKGMELALVIAALSFLVLIFTNDARWYLIIVHTVLFNVAMAGLNQNSFSITYSYVPGNYVSQALAFKSSITGVLGFTASIIGGKILNSIQVAGNTFMGISIYGQQILAVISLILIVMSIFYMHFVVSKQKVTIQ